MLTLRKKYSVDIMLNDGGRIMSNGVRDSGLLGEERVTLEPYPGNGLIPNEIESYFYSWEERNWFRWK